MLEECPICGGELVRNEQKLSCADCELLLEPIEKDVETISPAEVRRLLQKPQDFLLMDVRRQEEFDLVNIKGSKLIPLHTLHLVTEDLDPKKPIVTYCHHGRRSLWAARFLAQKGFKVKSMEGGIDKYSKEEDATLQRY